MGTQQPSSSLPPPPQLCHTGPFASCRPRVPARSLAVTCHIQLNLPVQLPQLSPLESSSPGFLCRLGKLPGGGQPIKQNPESGSQLFSTSRGTKGKNNTPNSLCFAWRTHRREDERRCGATSLLRDPSPHTLGTRGGAEPSESARSKERHFECWAFGPSPGQGEGVYLREGSRHWTDQSARNNAGGTISRGTSLLGIRAWIFREHFQLLQF